MRRDWQLLALSFAGLGAAFVTGPVLSGPEPLVALSVLVAVVAWSGAVGMLGRESA